MPYCKIEAIGIGTPNQLVSNQELANIINATGVEPDRRCDAEFILTRTGIQHRRFLGSQQTVDDIAYEALKATNPGKLDAIIVASNSAQNIPSVSSRVLARARKESMEFCPNVFAIDLVAGCGGINYALETANAFMLTRKYQRIAVIGAEELSNVLDFRDRDTASVLADGASAYILSRQQGDEYGFVGWHTITESKNANIIMEHSGPRVSLFEAQKALGSGSKPELTTGRILGMEGRKVHAFVCSTMRGFYNEFQNIFGVPLTGVKYIVPHQANGRMFDKWEDDIPALKGRIIRTIENYGNNSTASQGPGVKIALDHASPGDYILMLGFGAGLSIGANLYRIPPQ